MKEDSSIYEYLVKETKEKINRLEERYDCGTQINKLKLGFGEKIKASRILLPNMNIIVEFKLINSIINFILKRKKKKKQ